MNEQHISGLLHSLFEGTLTVSEQEFITEHTSSCLSCRKELEEMRTFIQAVSALPKERTPKRDLWDGIEKVITQPRKEQSTVIRPEFEKNEHQTVTLSLYYRIAAVVLVCVIGAALYFFNSVPDERRWKVKVLQGSPVVDNERIDVSGSLAVGECLQTDSVSRAELTVGLIGSVALDPNTEIRLLNIDPSDHRLSLDKGTIHASVSAPPRLFVVETPSASAIDLGCAYTLSVDSNGASTLSVTTGWVSLEYGGRESVVPEGAMCNTKSTVGPGTPYMKQTSDTLKQALFVFDFEGGGKNALDEILAHARYYDAVTLWHILFRVEDSEKGRVYDTLVRLVPAPEGVTREGVLLSDEKMLQLWRNHLKLNPYAMVAVPVDAVSQAPP